MTENSKSGYENLGEEQERTLNALLYLIIPPSENGKMPSATDINFFTYMYSENLISWIRPGLLSITEESHKVYGREFSERSPSEQMQLIHTLRRKLFRFFSHLTTHVMMCYYQNDHVLVALGLEPRPPFPSGYLVEDGDLTLLEDVYKRGKLYRDV